MPSGHIHAQDSILIGAGVLTLAVWQNWDLAPSVAVAAGSVSGLVLSPDLDQDGWTRSELILRRIPLVRYIFFIYWLPYAWIMPHRHWASHAPVVGTVVRLLYLAPLVLFLLWFTESQWGWDIYRLSEAVAFWGQYWVQGLALSDAAHWLRDFW